VGYCQHRLYCVGHERSGGGTSTGGYGVYGTSSSGTGIYGSTGTGYGGRFASTSGTGAYVTGANGTYSVGTATNGVGLWGVADSGSGAYGVYGTSSSGAGVVGSTTTGTALRGNGNGSSTTALEVNNGGIKVTGAGANTSTPAFRAVVTAGNRCAGTDLYIDNPYSNNDPNAILIVTTYQYEEMYIAYSPPGCPAGKWVIAQPQGMSVGDSFSVLVVKP
jgi:hypothetical protein